MALLGIRSTHDLPEQLTPELHLDAVLPEQVARITGWGTIQDVMGHVGRDLAARALVSNPLDCAKEARCRELISPVLMAAVLIAGAGDIEMHAEFHVDGVHAGGSVDWAIVYKKFNIVVVEAKLFSKWEEHLGQLIAEMVGSREEFATMQLGKRKEEVALAMPKVASWGIMTTGLAYKFYQLAWVDEGSQGSHMVLYESQPISLQLDRGATHTEAQSKAIKVVAFLKHVLELQVASIKSLSLPSAKRQCS
mmetsp:Transcript_21054/g.53527  ORF Transcript_21054/g.53527 Transcript_21054/m.53527 type:complete len:250 (-) Transcript_21054:290-1039(-)